jgi:hypothetical protein
MRRYKMLLESFNFNLTRYFGMTEHVWLALFLSRYKIVPEQLVTPPHDHMALTRTFEI